MRFGREEMMFHRIEIGAKAAKVTEVIKEKVGRAIKTPFRVITNSVIQNGDIFGSLPIWGFPNKFLFNLFFYKFWSNNEYVILVV